MSYQLEKQQTPYEKMENRFKIFATELAYLDTEIEKAGDNVDPSWYEKRDVLADNIDMLLRRVVELGYVKSEPLEDKIYKLTFEGRINGKLRKTW